MLQSLVYEKQKNTLFWRHPQIHTCKTIAEVGVWECLVALGSHRWFVQSTWSIWYVVWGLQSAIQRTERKKHTWLQCDTDWYRLIQIDTDWYRLIQYAFNMHVLGRHLAALPEMFLKGSKELPKSIACDSGENGHKSTSRQVDKSTSPGTRCTLLDCSGLFGPCQVFCQRLAIHPQSAMNSG